jgi:hypothetical protein
LSLGLSLRKALLGFVALNPTYMLPALWRNAKPNNDRFRNRVPKVSFSIKPAVFQAGGPARLDLKLAGQCHPRIVIGKKPAPR